MEADSFFILKENSKDDKLCLLKYNGPEAIIFDEKLDCITNIPISKSNKDTDVFLALETSYCNDEMNTIEMTYWKIETCFNKSNFLIPSYVQVKLTAMKLFVYCYPYTIRLYSKVTICPNSVFTLPKQTTFEILVGDQKNPIYLYKFKGVNIKFRNLFNFREDWSNRLNFYIIPDKYKSMNISIINDEIEQLGKMTIDLSSQGELFHKIYIEIKKCFSGENKIIL